MNAHKSGHERTKFSVLLEKLISIRRLIALLLQSTHQAAAFRVIYTIVICRIEVVWVAKYAHVRAAEWVQPGKWEGGVVVGQGQELGWGREEREYPLLEVGYHSVSTLYEFGVNGATQPSFVVRTVT